MGPGMVSWAGYRYSPPTGPPGYHTPGTPLPTAPATSATSVPAAESKVAVGLRSVGQLTLDAEISDIMGMTEVYNLVEINRINNHFLIPGND